jgi:hypothetical protein
MKYEHFESDLKLNEEFIPLSMVEPLDKDRKQQPRVILQLCQDRRAYKLLAHEAGVHGVWSLVIGAGNRALLYGHHCPTSHISLSLYQPCRKRVRSAKYTLLKSLPGLTYIERGNVITKNKILLN